MLEAVAYVAPNNAERAAESRGYFEKLNRLIGGRDECQPYGCAVSLGLIAAPRSRIPQFLISIAE
ncbi:MAG: hypothetical protein ACREP6_04905 [Candidatus Binataceae bacterium]